MKPHRLFPILLCVLCISAPIRETLWAAEDQPPRRYLYMSTPDGAQGEGASGAGILIFDIDDGHKFVRRIDIPVFAEGLRGLTGSKANRALYFSTTNHRLGAFDLATEEILWNKTYGTGCDRTCTTPDGKRLYSPTGWWHQGDDAGFLIIDAFTGELIERKTVGPKAHNSIASLDGRFVYLGTLTTLTQFEASTGKVLQTITPVGEKGVFPYTIDSRNRFAFVCLGGHAGFDVVDLAKGEPIHRVFAIDEKGEKSTNRTHGAGLTPDETELWISDQNGQRLFIFDATIMPPIQTGHVELSMAGHGWVSFSLDGAFAWCHTPDVFDARTKEKIATLRDENGDPFASSKFIEVHFRGDKIVEVGNEFGLGRRY